MKQGFDSFLRDLAKDNSLGMVVLLFGDDLQVQSACKSLIDVLVLKEQREFNLERFDGRSAAWNQIESSLMTPPFLPGKKVVWVENAPYFFSRENRGELAERIMQLWSDGKRDDACKLLLDLLALEGWTAEQWQQLESRRAAGVYKLLAVEDQDGEAAEVLVSYCKSREFELKESRGSEEHAILKLLEGDLPSWDFLLFTAVQVDRRTRLYKRLEESGGIFYLGLERDRYGRISRDQLRQFIEQQLRRSGKLVEPRARELLLLRAGDDLRTLQQELEKLMLYVGEQGTICVSDVEAIFSDQTEGWIFDLTRFITTRDAPAALRQLARLVAQGDHPLKILSTIAAEVRKLLCARQLIEGDLRGRWRRGMTFNQFEQTVLDPGTALLTRNSYADYLSLQRAEIFSLQELLSYVRAIHDADLRLKSTGSNPQIVMERLILHMCMRARRAPRATATAAI
jgi:DNA polymerase III subunit delta